MTGGVCMLFAGELAVRKVSEMESTVALRISRFDFRVTARIQVVWTRLSFSAGMLTSPPRFSCYLLRSVCWSLRLLCGASKPSMDSRA